MKTYRLQIAFLGREQSLRIEADDYRVEVDGPLTDGVRRTHCFFAPDRCRIAEVPGEIVISVTES